MRNVATGSTRVSQQQVHLLLMLLLTFSTGVVDAVGYLGLDRVFTGNMTGNVVIFGMGVVGGNGLPVLGPLLALVGFMVGAAVVGRALRNQTEAWSTATTAVLAAVGLVVLALAVVLYATGTPGKSLQITCTTSLGAAMGMQAAAARIVAVKDVTTVVVTSTITGLAADSVFGSGTAQGGAGRRRASAVLAIIAGAIAGAGLLKLDRSAGLLLAAAVILAVAVIGGPHARTGRTPTVHRVTDPTV